MRRVGQLFDAMISSDALRLAWGNFRRNKGGRPGVRAFAPQVERELAALHDELSAGKYRPQPYRLLLLHEPKRRLIAAAPVRDRIVHHAIVGALGPRLDPGLVASTFACIAGRGTHRALLAIVAAMRQRHFAVFLDVRHYFLSIDRAILMQLMAQRIKDQRVLALLGAVAESGAGLYEDPAIRAFLGLPDGTPGPGCGLPIGNLTSQWWGNYYLSGFDHFALRALKVGDYQRYMDDIVLLGDDARELTAARDAAAAWLWEHRRLRLKRPDAPVLSTREAVTYLGHRVTRAGATPTRKALRRMQQRIGERVLRRTAEQVERTIAAYRGALRLGTVGEPG